MRFDASESLGIADCFLYYRRWYACGDFFDDTTLAALMARSIAGSGKTVLAIDADINQHLAHSLGMNKEAASSIPALVALAAGTLLGDAFIHLIPESLEALENEALFATSILAGIVFFFFLEKEMRWHHAHHGSEEEHEGHERFESASHTPHTHLAPLVIAADGIHNMVDGMLIAATYAVSIPLGIATTIAVFLHELPQEIADFALLIHAGLSRSKALAVNFLSALTAFVGAGLFFAAHAFAEGLAPLIAAFTAGAFIYIAAADLIPELHTNTRLRSSLIQAAAFMVGIGIMFALTALEVGH